MWGFKKVIHGQIVSFLKDILFQKKDDFKFFNMIGKKLMKLKNKNLELKKEVCQEHAGLSKGAWSTSSRMAPVSAKRSPI